jgi:hypothetical protein
MDRIEKCYLYIHLRQLCGHHKKKLTNLKLFPQKNRTRIVTNDT